QRTGGPISLQRIYRIRENIESGNRRQIGGNNFKPVVAGEAQNVPCGASDYYLGIVNGESFKLGLHYYAFDRWLKCSVRKFGIGDGNFVCDELWCRHRKHGTTCCADKDAFSIYGCERTDVSETGIN